jgi:tRNA threonylcarbamoyladenosine biosynthesis protein TsaB
VAQGELVSKEGQPRLLILETSGRVGQVAVAQGDALRGVRPLDEARRHARDLAPAVRDLLEAQGWTPQDLDAVIVSRGPGSYTGLRVGIMSAKTLAYATGCALLAVDTFAAVAAQCPAEALCVDIVADAQQDKVYVERFARPAANLPFRSATPLCIRPFSEWLALLAPPIWASGPGLRIRDGRFPEGVRVAPPSCWDPQPESLLQLGLARYRNGERDDFWALEPLYLRPSSAEEQWAKKTSS